MRTTTKGAMWWVVLVLVVVAMGACGSDPLHTGGADDAQVADAGAGVTGPDGGAAALPACGQPIAVSDSCVDAPRKLCCYRCYVDTNFMQTVQDCTGVTATGNPIICATSIDECR